MIDTNHIIKKMSQWIDDYHEYGRCRQVIVTGFHGIWEAHKHKNFRTILNSSDLWIPDGIAPVWVARCRGLRNVKRTPGAEVMKAFFQLADKKRYKSFFYGDTEETLASLKKTLEESYPGHKIVGTFSPPFRQLTHEEDEKVIRMINKAQPDVLWVGLGLPKQDRWIFKHKDKLNVPIAIGVGAAFGFLSGKVKRVPEWIGNNGLEWLWRFIQEPKKLWKRDLLDGPGFVFHVIMELTGLRKYD